MYVKPERPSLTREGGRRHDLSSTYNAALSSFPRQLYNHSHLGHLALTTHMKAGWVNKAQVPLMTLKLRAHLSPSRPCKDTPTQGLRLPSS